MTPPSPRAEIRDQAALCLETLDLASRASRISGGPEVEAVLDLAVRTGMDAMNTLTGKLGAASPLRARQVPVKGPDRFALSSLVTLDTPEARRLLLLLERAQAAAEMVDAQRGRSLGEEIELLPGESRGTDLSESISEIALRVWTEVNGPSGRD